MRKLTLYGLIQSQDGRFRGLTPSVYMKASNIEGAKKLADEYTNGSFSKNPGFYHLQKETIKIFG